MKKLQIFSLLSWIFLCSLVMVGCGQTNTTNQVADSSASPATTANSTTEAGNLTVSAAASLKDALNEIETVYEKQKPNVHIRYNFGASGSLEQQIQQGAPVDLFISAGVKQMDGLQKGGLIINDTKKNLLSNQVVLIVPQNSSGITSFQDLATSKVKKVALGEPKSVPAGQYADQVLTSYKILNAVKPKAVYAKDVRQVLNYVESGNIDAGIVYTSDAKSSSKVKVAATAPENTHSPVTYPIAVVKSSKNAATAKDFEQFLFSNQAKTIFEKDGFILSGS